MRLEELLNPQTTALLVVDIQVDYCSPEGKLPKFLKYDTKPIQEMIPRLANFISESRQYKIPVIWTRMNETPKDMPKNLRLKMESRGKPALALCTPGTPGFEYYQIYPEEGDKEIVKTHYNAFTDTDLHQYLRNRNIENIIFTGVYTSRCVDTTLRLAADDKGYNCVVPKDLVAMTASEKHELEHKAALSVWDSIFAYVVNSEDIIKIWRK